ncbi:MAG: sulfotransferase [Phycisphaerales bacterium]
MSATPSKRKINRNDPCPCGSGRKFKKCCMLKTGSGARSSTAASSPSSAAAPLLARAAQAMRSGAGAEAKRLYERALDRDPANLKALFDLAQLHAQAGARDEAVALLERAIQIDDRHAAFHLRLGDLRLAMGDDEGAVAHSERAVALDPESPLGHAMLGYALERLHRLDEALAAVNKGLRRAPADPDLRILRGRLLRRLGRLTEARDELRATIRVAPMRPRQGRKAWSELGLALDRLGDYDDAYDAFERMGEVTRSLPEVTQIDSKWAFDLIDHQEAAYTAERLQGAATRADALAGPAPVFLVGFPRSGTTLTEQILAAHPSVTTSDENAFIRMASQEGAARYGASLSGCVDPAALDDPAAINSLREYYWDRARETLGDQIVQGVFVDKMPLNLVELGFVNAIFPDSRVVVVTRDPRDVVLSCFMQNFDLNAAMIQFTNLDDATRYYDRVMTWWGTLRTRLTLHLMEIRYRDLVDAFDDHARRLVEFVGLEWDDAVGRFHEVARDRAISTPSYEAVTAPTHSKRVDRWRNYSNRLEPWLDRLEPHVVALGFDTPTDGEES